MENENEPGQGSQPPREALFFLEVLLACTPDELGRINAAIRAAHHLPSGADKVIAAGIADPAIAAKLEQLEAKRIKARQAGTVYAQGMSREQIRATAQQGREAAEARRQERERQRQQREAQLEAEKRERAEARKLAQQQRRERLEAERRDREQRREQIRAERQRRKTRSPDAPAEPPQPQPEQITAAAISTPPRNKRAIRRKAAAVHKYKKKK